MKKSIQTIQDLSRVAKELIQGHKKGTAIGLSGQLGVGKTEFVRQAICLIARQNLCDAPKVVSPSFVIYQSYPQLIPCVHHFDLYRLENVTREGLIDIGYYDALESTQEKGGLLFVEWPEKVLDQQDLQLAIRISFFLEEGVRSVVFS